MNFMQNFEVIKVAPLILSMYYLLRKHILWQDITKP